MSVVLAVDSVLHTLVPVALEVLAVDMVEVDSVALEATAAVVDTEEEPATVEGEVLVDMVVEATATLDLLALNPPGGRRHVASKSSDHSPKRNDLRRLLLLAFFFALRVSLFITDFYSVEWHLLNDLPHTPSAS